MNFLGRREKLTEAFSQTLFLIPSGERPFRSHSVAYRAKAAGDFHYLTGLGAASGSILLIAGSMVHLFVQSFGAEDRLFDDAGSFDDAEKSLLSGITVQPLSELAQTLGELLPSFDRLAMPISRDAQLDKLVLSLLSYRRGQRTRRRGPLLLGDSRTLVGTIRLRKEVEEIACLAESAQRSSRVHRGLMSCSWDRKTESEIANWIESEFLREGMAWTAYETIVGSANRTTILHARPTERVVGDGEILLVDAGGEWKGYCADITRVFPVGKKFTPSQRRVYQAVLRVQKSVLAAVRPGINLTNLDEQTRSLLNEELSDLGIKDSDASRRFMPHPTSHWLGLDVHDPSPYISDSGQEIALAEGMSFTVEPGLYFREQWGGIGIRIEDDVVVTKTGCRILSSVPKEIEEIEDLRQQVR